MKSFNTLYSLFSTYIQNSNTDLVALGKQLINDAHRYLLQKYFNNEFSSTAYGVAQQQAYDLPANYSKMKTITMTNGVLKWTLTEVLTRQEWDRLNVFPYYSDVPLHYFIYNGKANIWPIPASGSTSVVYSGLATSTFTAGDTVTSGGVTGTVLSVATTSTTAGTIVMSVAASSWGGTAFPSTGTVTDSTSGATATIVSSTVTAGQLLTYNYKIRVPDLTFADTTGTCTVTSGSPAVASLSVSPLTTYLTTAGNASNLNLYLQPAAPKGDNNWYQVKSLDSATALTLSNVYPSTNATQTTTTYIIGQMPLIAEDFHDLLVYRPLMIYFSSIQADEGKAAQFKSLYEEGEQRLAEYSGSKSFDVNLGRRPQSINPNLFYNA